MNYPSFTERASCFIGIKWFIAISDGKFIYNPKYLTISEKRLIQKQKQVSRKKKGSNNRKEAIIKLAKQHKHISNQRNDFQHKESRNIVNNYDAIGAEKLNIKNMVRNHNLAKSINDAGWGMFLSYVEYKAEEAGKLFMKVDSRYTSMTCSTPGCGYINSDLKLSDRERVCPNCHTHHDRDINSAINVDCRMLEKIRQELPEYTLVETGSVDDIVSSNYVLKSTPPMKQEALSVKEG